MICNTLQLFIVILLFLINLRIMILGGTIESSVSKKEITKKQQITGTPKAK